MLHTYTHSLTHKHLLFCVVCVFEKRDLFYYIIYNRKPILTLPPIDTKVIHVQFTQAERDFYNALLAKSIDIFEGFVKAGTAEKSWLAIFSLLARLRMACDHIALTVKSHINDEEWYTKTVAGKKNHNDENKNNNSMTPRTTASAKEPTDSLTML